MHSTRHKYLALAILALAATVRADMPPLCNAAVETEFRDRIHEAGKFDLYDEYGILRTLVESRAHDYDQNERTIQSYQEDAALVSHLLNAIDDEFPGDRAVELYNNLSRYDGTVLENPDETKFTAHLPPTSKQQFEEKLKTCEDPKDCKLAMLKLRYHIVSLGVYLDKNVESLRATQEKHFTDLKAMMIRASLLRLKLQAYCPFEGATRFSSNSNKRYSN